MYPNNRRKGCPIKEWILPQMILWLLSALLCSARCAAQDTTFILPMQEDHAKCYYMERLSNGEVHHGIYENGDIFRINTGLAKDPNGNIIDTVLYACDRVTKQWFPYNHPHQEAHENGMVKYTDYEEAYTYHSQIREGQEYELRLLQKRFFWQYNADGLLKEKHKESYSYAGYTHLNRYQELRVTEYDTCGNPLHVINAPEGTDVYFEYNYTNIYDNEGNLLSAAQTPEELTVYTYDNNQRRLSEKHTETNEDSLIVRKEIHYFFIDASDSETEDTLSSKPYIIFMKNKDNPLEGFSSEKKEYDFTGKYMYEDLNLFYFISQGASAYESYDVDKNTLTITVKGENYESDTTQQNIYKLTFDRSGMLTNPVLTSLTVSGMTIEGFNPKKFRYKINNYIHNIGYTIPEGTNAQSEYDEGTDVLTIKVWDTNNPIRCNTYTIQLKKKTALLSSFTFNGEEMIHDFSSVRDEYTHEISIPHIYTPDLIKFETTEEATVNQTFDESTFELLVEIYQEGDYDMRNKYIIKFKEYEFDLLSFTLNNEKIDHIEELNHLDDVSYMEGILHYEVSEKASVQETFDTTNQILTVRVMGANYTSNPTCFHEYKFQFRPLGDGLPSVGSDQSALYTEGNTICIDDLKVPIVVCDATGKIMGTGEGDKIRIQVFQAGVYIVNAAGTTHKVVVAPF